MPQNFASPWAAAGSAIFDYLADREASQRQEMLDAIVAKREERLLESTAAGIENQRAQTALAQESARSLQDQRAATTADNRLKTVLTRANTMAPNTDLDETSAGEFEGVGLGHLIRRQAPVEAPAIVAPGYEADAPQASPGILQFAGLPQAPAPPEKLEVREVGGFLYERQPSGEWKKVAEGRPPQPGSGGGANGGTPYFMPVSTAQGVVPFNARTGQFQDENRRDLKPGETAQKELVNAESVLTRMNSIEQRFNPDWVGPLAGRVASMATAVSDQFGQEGLAALQAEVAGLQNTVIQLRTGAQMSEQEAARIMTEIPNMNLPPGAFMEKLGAARKYFEDWYRRRSDVAYGNRGSNGGFGTQPPVPGAPAPAPGVVAQPPAAPQAPASKYKIVERR
jgi:hypothetical protein